MDREDALTRGKYVTQHRPEAFGGPGGRAARRAFSYAAFVPAPVADIDLSLSGATAADVADAERALTDLQRTAANIEGFDGSRRTSAR